MKHLVLAFLLTASAAHGETLALHCGHLLDVRAGKTLHDQVILVSQGKITAVGPTQSIALPPGATAVDLAGATCLPGLIDVHTHITMDPTDSGYEGLGISIPRAAIIGARNARRTLRAGFTTIRNLHADGYSDVALRDGIDSGDVEGPRMLVSGPALGITGGHADNNLLPFEMHSVLGGVADGPWAARTKVREVIKYGADVIKVMASGGVISKGDTPGVAQYTLEELRAIVDEAHKLGRRVAAHAHGTQSIKDSIVAGVDSVEHASLIDDEGIALAKTHGTYLVFDIYDDDFIIAHGAEAGMLPEYIAKERIVGQAQRENFRRAHAAHIKIAFGTDAGVYPHGDNAKQFAKMVEWGMTPMEAIRAATLSAADLLGWENSVGTLAPGYYADIIAVRSDPLEYIAALESVQFVMKGGVVVRNDVDARLDDNKRTARGGVVH